MKKLKFLAICLVLIVSFSTITSTMADSKIDDPIYSKLASAGFYNYNTTSSAQSLNLSNEVTDVVSSYFNERLTQYGRLEFEKNRLDAYISSNASYKMQATLKLMEAQISILASSGDKLGFSNFDYSINYISAQPSSLNTIELCLYLNYDIEYNGFDGIVSSITKEPHKLTLILSNGGWLIYEHEMFNSISIALEEKETSRQALDSYLANYVSSMVARNKSIENAVPLNIDGTCEDAISIINSVQPTRAINSYDRSDACSYARTYANSDNPSPWHTFTADCTNFVSIALRKGGLPQDSSGSNTWYWNSRSDRSASWAGAKYLRPYLINNNSSSTSNTGVYATSVSLSSCSRGDVVSFEAGGDIHHNAILTSYTTSGGWLLCQHSHSQGSKDVPLQTVIDWEEATVYYTHIKGYY